MPGLSLLPWIVMCSVNKNSDPIEHRWQTENEARNYAQMAQGMGFIAEVYYSSGCRVIHKYDLFPEGYEHPKQAQEIEVKDYDEMEIELEEDDA